MIAACNGTDASNPPQKGGETNPGAVKLGSLSSKAPPSWQEQKPTSNLRVYQFALPKAAGDPEDAELAIFYFDGEGGSAEENIKRWQGFFAAPAGKKIDDVSKVDKFKVGATNVTYLDITGSFLSKNPPFDPNAKTVKKDNYRRFGVVFESKPGPYFLTVTGPAKTLEHHKKDFDEWLKNFK
jgi:hypothetical protein